LAVVRWVCVARGHSPLARGPPSAPGSGNLTSLKGWPSASSSWRAQKVGKPAECTYIFVPGDELTIHSRAQPCVQGTAHFAVAPRAWARSPAYCRGGKHRHRPACLSFRTSLLEVTKNPCSTVATARAAPLRRRAGRTSARTAPLAALQANRPPSPHGQPQTPGLSAGGLWGAAWPVAPHTPGRPPPKTPRPPLRGGLLLFLQCPHPSFPTHIPAPASNSHSRRRKAPKKIKRAGIKLSPNPLKRWCFPLRPVKPFLPCPLTPETPGPPTE
jgi:hypothetical protein